MRWQSNTAMKFVPIPAQLTQSTKRPIFGGPSTHCRKTMTDGNKKINIQAL